MWLPNFGPAMEIHAALERSGLSYSRLHAEFFGMAGGERLSLSGRSGGVYQEALVSAVHLNDDDGKAITALQGNFRWG